ncbi:MAG: thiamine diphosphokinase, partial [Oscillospiraceae bacterium]
GKGRILSENDEIQLLDSGTYHIKKRMGYSLSLLAYSDEVKGLTISGVKYTAENVYISNTFPLGISNIITEEKADITFNSGKLLVIQSKL